MTRGIIRPLIQRLQYGDPVVVVSGLPRSGTSMLMQMLNAGGLACATDDERAADEDNPKGYFEVERVKSLATEGQDKGWLRSHRGQAIKVISFLLPQLPLDLRYRVLFIRRNMDEILASQRKMLVHRGEDPEASGDELMSRSFAAHLQQVDSYLEQTPNFESLFVEHEEVLTASARVAGVINEFLGRRLDEVAMANAVDGALHRNRASGS